MLMCIIKVNPFAGAFMMMREVADDRAQHIVDPAEELQLVFDFSKKLDMRRCNLPAVNEVAAIVVGNRDDDFSHHCLVVRERTRDPNEKKLRKIFVTDPHADPMSYPLLFPRGDEGFKKGMQRQRRPHDARDSEISMLQVSYRVIYCVCSKRFDVIVFSWQNKDFLIVLFLSYCCTRRWFVTSPVGSSVPAVRSRRLCESRREQIRFPAMESKDSSC